MTTTKVGKDYNLYFEKNAQNVQQWPTIKDAGAQDVSKNYDFNTTTVVSGLLEVIEDPGVLYVRPLADTYGSFQNGKGFIKVEVVGADDDDVNKALENLLNNKKVTPRVFTSENPDFAAYNGKILDVTAFDAAPTAEILAAAGKPLAAEGGHSQKWGRRVGHRETCCASAVPWWRCPWSRSRGYT